MTRAVALFEALNQWVRPLALMGLGSPTPMQPTGLVVLEVTGRKSGTVRQVPVLGLLVPGGVLVSTVRPDSQWLANLAASERAHLWLWGQRMAVVPAVVVPGGPVPEALPSWLRPVVGRAATQLGLQVAWLGPCSTRDDGVPAAVTA